jgi:hypothetical protein
MEYLVGIFLFALACAVARLYDRIVEIEAELDRHRRHGG